jgi:hypothetical protein
MDKYFVIPEIASQMQEIGFRDACIRGFILKTKNISRSLDTCDYNANFIEYVSLPLYSHALDWFEEKHGIRSFIIPSYVHEDKPYSFSIGRVNYSELGYASREEAQSECIKMLVEIVKQKP